MIITETKLKGAFLIDIERIEDERGFFARSWDKKIFEEYEMNTNIVQTSIAFSKKRGTLRGMHYQRSPYEETKLIRCTQGSIYDVLLDLRPLSHTFKKWFSIELNKDNHKIIYVPKGFAHGYQTLDDNTEVFYQMTQIHMSDYENGIRWDDPKFSILWPNGDKIISQKDNSWDLHNSY